jgi:type IV pilus assembly protein PilW
MSAHFNMRSRRTAAGFSLIDIMVGLVIGLIAVLVIYQVFAASEGIKRNTTSVGDAQQNGLLSSFIMSVELANAASAMASAQSDLMQCKPSPDVASFASYWKPIPVLITAGATDADPDQFIVTYSTSNGVIAPAPFVAPAAANAATYNVQSPQGFKIDDVVVAISKNGASDCTASRVTGVSAPTPQGAVVITQTGTPVNYTGNSVLFNMGQTTTAQRARYDVANGVLRSTSLLNANGGPDAAPVPNPLASNIVNIKLQYGVDNNGDGLLDGWVSAHDAPWRDVDMLNATAATLNKIKAVRIGIVAQGEQFDQELKNRDDVVARKWNLFGGTLVGGYTGDVQHGFRYRTYEMVVPLRNPIWNN